MARIPTVRSTFTHFSSGSPCIDDAGGSTCTTIPSSESYIRSLSFTCCRGAGQERYPGGRQVSPAMAEVAAANKERFQFQAMADKTILQKDFDNQMLHQQNQALHQQIQALQQELQLLRGFVPHLASNSAHLQAGPPPSSAPLQAGPPPSSALFQAGLPPSSAQFQAGPPPSQVHCQAAPSTSSVPLRPDPHASSALALRPSPVGTPPTQQRAQPTYAAAIAPTPTPGADGCYNLTPEQYRSLVAKGENSNTGKLSVSKPPTYSGKGRPDRWLDKVVQCFQAACIPEKDYITHTLPLLEINSPADAWWRSIGSTIPDLSSKKCRTRILSVIPATLNLSCGTSCTQAGSHKAQTTCHHMYSISAKPLWMQLTCHKLTSSSGS